MQDTGPVCLHCVGMDHLVWHCCIKATGVLAVIQSNKAGASGPVENHDKPGIEAS